MKIWKKGNIVIKRYKKGMTIEIIEIIKEMNWNKLYRGMIVFSLAIAVLGLALAVLALGVEMFRGAL